MFVKSSSNIGYGAKWVAYSRFMQNETPDSNFEYIEHTKLVRVIQKYNDIESIASRSLDRGCKYKSTLNANAVHVPRFYINLVPIYKLEYMSHMLFI